MCQMRSSSNRHSSACPIVVRGAVWVWLFLLIRSHYAVMYVPFIGVGLAVKVLQQAVALHQELYLTPTTETASHGSRASSVSKLAYAAVFSPPTAWARHNLLTLRSPLFPICSPAFNRMAT